MNNLLKLRVLFYIYLIGATQFLSAVSFSVKLIYLSWLLGLYGNVELLWNVLKEPPLHSPEDEFVLL